MWDYSIAVTVIYLSNSVLTTIAVINLRAAVDVYTTATLVVDNSASPVLPHHCMLASTSFCDMVAVIITDYLILNRNLGEWLGRDYLIMGVTSVH